MVEETWLSENAWTSGRFGLQELEVASYFTLADRTQRAQPTTTC